MKNRDGPRSPVVPLVVFLALFYLLTHPGPPDRGDENTMLLMAESMVFEGRLSVEPRAGRPTLVLGKDGMYYTKLGIGQSLAEAPFLFVGRTVGRVLVPREKVLAFGRFFAGLLPVTLTVLTTVMLYMLAGKLGYGKLVALVASAVFGVATLAWPYAGSLLSEPLQMACFMLCVWGLWRWGAGGSGAWLASAAFGLGFAITAKPAVAVALPFVTISAAMVMARNCGRDLRGWAVHVALWAAPLALWSAVNLWYNWARFGSLFSLGYETLERDVEIGFGTPWFTGIYGLLLSAGKGLLLYVPVSVLALFGAARFWRKDRWLTLLVAGISVPVLLVSARWHGWHGDYSWGPRYIAPLMPLIVLLTLPVWARSIEERSAVRRIALIALVVLSVIVQALGVFVDPKRYPHLVHYFTDTQVVYSRSDEKTRDDLLLNHFVPEFSPIVAHVWLLRYGLDATFVADTPEVRQRAAENAPWLSLNRSWTVRVGGADGIGEGFLMLNSWSVKWRHVMLDRPVPALSLMMLLGLGTGASAVWVVIRARRLELAGALLARTKR